MSKSTFIRCSRVAIRFVNIFVEQNERLDQ